MPLKKVCTRFYHSFILTITSCFFLLSFAAGQAGADSLDQATPPATPINDSSLTSDYLARLLASYPQYFDSITANPARYQVQVIYSTIDRGANGIAVLNTYYYQVNDRHYFYPGPAVDLPIAVFTLQKLDSLTSRGVALNSTFLTETGFPGLTAAYNDPTAPGGQPSLQRYLQRMLVGRDPAASNRLYEFLGQEYINRQLQLKGYTGARILQRQGATATEALDRHTNALRFVGPGNQTKYIQPVQYNGQPYPKITDSLALNWYQLHKPAASLPGLEAVNNISLEQLHNMLVSLVFPRKVTASQRFDLSDEERRYLLRYLGQYAPEAASLPYHDDTARYFPAFDKYLLLGAEPGPVPTGLRIFNVAGRALGQLEDVAYIVDFDKKIEFFLSAVIRCCGNNDGDGDAGGCKPGMQFMKQLGQVIYEQESARVKKIEPDLGETRFNYKEE